MSDSTNYKMEITGEGFDPEFILFKLLRDCPEAGNYFDLSGKPKGNGYDWRSIVLDMCAFTAANPLPTFFITEYGAYDSESFEYRYYFHAGKFARIEPVVMTTWPEFSPDMLTKP